MRYGRRRENDAYRSEDMFPVAPGFEAPAEIRVVDQRRSASTAVSHIELLPPPLLGARRAFQCDIITQQGGRPIMVLVAPPQTHSLNRE